MAGIATTVPFDLRRKPRPPAVIEFDFVEWESLSEKEQTALVRTLRPEEVRQLAAALEAVAKGIAAGVAKQGLSACGMLRLAGQEPYPHQLETLDADARRIVLLWTRQGGKSRGIAAKALSAAQVPRQRIQIVSPGERQSIDLANEVRALYADIIDMRNGHKLAARIINRDKTEIEFDNGTVIKAFPAVPATVRGGPAHLILCEEAAFMSLELLNAMTPKLMTTGGQLIAFSTAWATDNWFCRAVEGKDGRPWRVSVVKADELVKIGAFSQELLDEERRAFGPIAYQREYECRFMAPADRVFNEDMVTELERRWLVGVNSEELAVAARFGVQDTTSMRDLFAGDGLF